MLALTIKFSFMNGRFVYAIHHLHTTAVFRIEIIRIIQISSIKYHKSVRIYSILWKWKHTKHIHTRCDTIRRKATV